MLLLSCFDRSSYFLRCNISYVTLQQQCNTCVKVSRYTHAMVQHYTSLIFLTNFIIWLLLLNSFPLRLLLFFSFFIIEIFFTKGRNSKPLEKHVFYARSLEMISSSKLGINSNYGEHKKRKTSFLRELVEDAGWYYPVLNKSVTTRK